MLFRSLRICALILWQNYRIWNRLCRIRILVLIHRGPLVPWRLVIALVISWRVSVILLVILVIPLITWVTPLEIGITILSLTLVLVKANTVVFLVGSVNLFMIRAHFRGCAVFRLGSCAYSVRVFLMVNDGVQYPFVQILFHPGQSMV